jgi:hypothetical protein
MTGSFLAASEASSETSKALFGARPQCSGKSHMHLDLNRKWLREATLMISVDLFGVFCWPQHRLFEQLKRRSRRQRFSPPEESRLSLVETVERDRRGNGRSSRESIRGTDSASPRSLRRVPRGGKGLSSACSGGCPGSPKQGCAGRRHPELDAAELDAAERDAGHSIGRRARTTAVGDREVLRRGRPALSSGHRSEERDIPMARADHPAPRHPSRHPSRTPRRIPSRPQSHLKTWR